MVAHLEVFTNRATRASPLHRFIEPTAPGRFPLYPFRSSAGRRHSVPSAVRMFAVSGWSRSTFGVANRQSGGLYILGDACVAPTQIYRTHRAWTLSIGTRFVPLRGRHNLRPSAVRYFPVSGVFAVDNRGRRIAQPGGLYEPGRRMRRPDRRRPGCLRARRLQSAAAGSRSRSERSA